MYSCRHHANLDPAVAPTRGQAEVQAVPIHTTICGAHVGTCGCSRIWHAGIRRWAFHLVAVVLDAPRGAIVATTVGRAGRKEDECKGEKIDTHAGHVITKMWVCPARTTPTQAASL